MHSVHGCPFILVSRQNTLVFGQNKTPWGKPLENKAPEDASPCMRSLKRNKNISK